MDTELLYRSSAAIAGGVIGMRGGSSIVAGNAGIAPILMVIGGSGMVTAALYGLLRSKDPSNSVPEDRYVWPTVLGAVLVCTGGLLHLVT